MQEKFNPPENKKFNSSSRNAVESLQRNKNAAKKSKVLERTWTLYDQSVTPIGSTFIKSLPKEYTGVMDENFLRDIDLHGQVFRKYIEETLENKDKKLKAIEFGGPGSRLFKSFSKDFFSKTVGVCLSDIRRKDDKDEDERNNHVVIEGDIFDKKTYMNLSKELDLGKFDLIVSRMMGPLEKIEKHPAVLQKVIQEWYGMLDDNGILFTQYEYFAEHTTDPDSKVSSLPKDLYEALTLTDTQVSVVLWVRKMKEILKDKVEFQVNNGILRIHKKQGAPEELPTVKEIP